VDPVSMTIISSTTSRTLSRHFARFADSFLTIMHRLSLSIGIREMMIGFISKFGEDQNLFTRGIEIEILATSFGRLTGIE
jgi:hypothetical protein